MTLPWSIARLFNTPEYLKYRWNTSFRKRPNGKIIRGKAHHHTQAEWAYHTLERRPKKAKKGALPKPWGNQWSHSK